MESIELIRTFVQDRLDVDTKQVHDDAVLADLGVDSLMIAELMFEAEDRLDITLEDENQVPVTVGEMRAIIDRVLSASRQASE